MTRGPLPLSESGYFVNSKGILFRAAQVLAPFARNRVGQLDVSNHPELQGLPPGHYTDEEFQQLLAARSHAGDE